MKDSKEFRVSKQPTQHSKGQAKTLRTNQTPPEGLLWWVLRRNQLLGQRFRRQAPLGVYIADFYCHTLRLVIEVDGKTHQQEQLIHDQRRDAWMQSKGVFVVRVQARDVFENLEGVRQMIEQVVRRRIDEQVGHARPPPSAAQTPPPSGRGRDKS